ncbi:MAG TPA: ribonuclease III [Gaiellaceae bacterium]|nr:ribonuclease III [Gaiellaceae bacterium]
MIDDLPPEAAEIVFTHVSWARERAASYERLEFLGDSVLELAVAHALYTRHPDYGEGSLTKARAHVVSRATCARVAAELDLGGRLVAHAPQPPPDDLERLAGTPSVIGAVLEAALGALFLEHGFAAIEDAVVAAFADHIEFAVTSRVDHKTDLQELLARTGRKVAYVEISADGPAHDRRFTCAALVDGEELGRGEGKSKKEAEQEAARAALAKVEAAPGT